MRKSKLQISRSQAEALAMKLAEPVLIASFKHSGLVFGEVKAIWPHALKDIKEMILKVMEEKSYVIPDKKD